MITRAYLEPWADGRGRVRVWDYENSVDGVRSLNDATVVGDAYRADVSGFDLEQHYSKIESIGVRLLRIAASGGPLSEVERDAIVDFLDMFLDRHRYAGQGKATIPASLVTVDFTTGESSAREVGMTLGDRLNFAKDANIDVVRLEALGVARWTWRVFPVEGNLVTGDGAVLLFREDKTSPITAICFPLSPKKVLVIGDGLTDVPEKINFHIAANSRRWVVDHVDGSMADAFVGWSS